MKQTQQVEFLTLEDVAGILGVTYKSARIYHQGAERRRRERKPRPADMPAPDRRFGRSPVWKRSTIERWLPLRGTY